MLSPVPGHVVMILHADRDAQGSGQTGAFPQGGDAAVPLLIEARGGVIEAGEDAHQPAIEVVGQPAQFADMKDLHFPGRDVRPVGGHAEVGVAGQADNLNPQTCQPVARSAGGRRRHGPAATGAAAWP